MPLPNNYGDGFSFNGVHISAYNAAFIIKAWPFLPQGIINKVEIPGRSGTIRYNGRWHKECKLTGTLYLLSDNSEPLTDAERIDAASAVARWLCPGYRANLIFDAAPNRYAIAEIETEHDISTSDWGSGQIDVTFVLQPFWYSTVNTAWSTGRVLTLGGNQPAPLTANITVTGTMTAVQLGVGDKFLKLQGFTLEPGKKILINCDPEKGELLEILVDGVPGMQYLTAASAAPLFVNPGVTTIAFTGTGTATGMVYARARWL